MKTYQSRVKPIAGTAYDELYPRAYDVYKRIKSRTKRRPYVKSAYFSKQGKKEKIFLEFFWRHLHQKNRGDRNRRLKYYLCALDLIRNSRCEPASRQNPNNTREILHRFVGITPDRKTFFVQIRENKKTGQKELVSVFPPE